MINSMISVKSRRDLLQLHVGYGIMETVPLLDVLSTKIGETCTCTCRIHCSFVLCGLGIRVRTNNSLIHTSCLSKQSVPEVIKNMQIKLHYVYNIVQNTST